MLDKSTRSKGVRWRMKTSSFADLLSFAALRT